MTGTADVFVSDTTGNPAPAVTGAIAGETNIIKRIAGGAFDLFSMDIRTFGNSSTTITLLRARAIGRGYEFDQGDHGRDMGVQAG